MLGARKENIVMCDSKGVISTSRPDLNAAKREFATDRPIKPCRRPWWEPTYSWASPWRTY